MNKDRAILIDIYNLLKDRLPGTASQKQDLNDIASKIKNSPVIDDDSDDQDAASANVQVFMNQFADLLQKMK